MKSIDQDMTDEPVDVGLSESATGRDLLETGLAIKPGSVPCMIWVVYQQME